jgi:acyl-CoA thioesterase FadM
MLDGQMLLHHPQYLILVERAQQAWMEKVLQAPRFDWRNFPDMYVVVRKIEIAYLLPVDGVTRLAVLLRPVKIRAAALEMAFEIRSADLQRLYCSGSRLNCKIDQQTHQPVFWTDMFRERVENAL